MQLPNPMGLWPKGTVNPISPSVGEPGIDTADGATAPSLPNTVSLGSTRRMVPRLPLCRSLLWTHGEPGIDTTDGVAAPSLPVRGDGIVLGDLGKNVGPSCVI